MERIPNWCRRERGWPSVKASELNASRETVVHITNSYYQFFSRNYDQLPSWRNHERIRYESTWVLQKVDLVVFVSSLLRSFSFFPSVLHPPPSAWLNFCFQWLMSAIFLLSTIIEPQKLLITIDGAELLFRKYYLPVLLFFFPNSFWSLGTKEIIWMDDMFPYFLSWKNKDLFVGECSLL